MKDVLSSCSEQNVSEQASEEVLLLTWKIITDFQRKQINTLPLDLALWFRS